MEREDELLDNGQTGFIFTRVVLPRVLRFPPIQLQNFNFDFKRI